MKYIIYYYDDYGVLHLYRQADEFEIQYERLQTKGRLLRECGFHRAEMIDEGHLHLCDERFLMDWYIA